MSRADDVIDLIDDALAVHDDPIAARAWAVFDPPDPEGIADWDAWRVGGIEPGEAMWPWFRQQRTAEFVPPAGVLSWPEGEDGAALTSHLEEFARQVVARARVAVPFTFECWDGASWREVSESRPNHDRSLHQVGFTG